MNTLCESLPNLLFCLIICICKIIEISLSSLKTVFLVKGNKTLASLFAFVECLIWGLVVSGIITRLNNNLFWLFSYCLGYALGFFIGSMIEGKLAIGTMDLQAVIPKKYEINIEKYLKEKGYGYYIVDCHGAEGDKLVITMIIKRKIAKKIRKEITEICEGNIFVMNFDVAYLHGGYGVRKNSIL